MRGGLGALRWQVQSSCSALWVGLHGPPAGPGRFAAPPLQAPVPERFPWPRGREAAPFLLLTRGGAAHDDRLHLDLGDSQQQRAVPLLGDGRHDGSSCTLDQTAVRQVAACRAEGLRQRTELRGSTPASRGLGPPPPVGQRAWPRVQPQGTLRFPSRPRLSISSKEGCGWLWSHEQGRPGAECGAWEPTAPRLPGGRLIEGRVVAPRRAVHGEAGEAWSGSPAPGAGTAVPTGRLPAPGSHA